MSPPLPWETSLLFMKSLIRITAVAALAASFAQITPVHAETAASPAAEVKSLKVGDVAPAFKVTEWFKGDAVTIDDSKTYIIECWATWCGPCIKAFPHLSDIAKANKDKITVIGVNVWERKSSEEVKAFVEKQGDNMSYLVAADGDKVIANDWLKAAGQNGIPCAFVVRKGKVNWIGHPSQLKQDLLDSILNDTFDVAAYAKAKEKEQAAANYFRANIMPLMMKKDYAAAIGKLEEMKKEFPDDAATIDGHIARLKGQMEKQ